MLNARARRPIARFVEPIAIRLNRSGVSPNVVTVAGTVAAVGVALWLIPTGHLFAAAVLMALFTAFDLVDGTMARLRGGGSRFGAVLDASCDRITDGALFAAIAWWAWWQVESPGPLVGATLTVLVASQVISYVKARAEASGFTVDGGLVERAERLIIGLTGLGLEGLGVPYAIGVAMWALAAGSVFTVVQRLAMVAGQPGASDYIAPPKGAEDGPHAGSRDDATRRCPEGGSR
ncbi:phosphatidylinositol phosphate synthase [Corynebacterium sp. 335C]